MTIFLYSLNYYFVSVFSFYFLQIGIYFVVYFHPTNIDDKKKNCVDLNISEIIGKIFGNLK